MSDATVQRPGRYNPGAFRVRLVSALVLAPPVLATIYLGSPFAEALVLLASGVMAWEWARICGQAATSALGAAGMAAVLCAVAAGALGHMALAGWIVATGAMAAALLAVRERHPRPLVCGLGVAYISVPCLAFLWLLHDPAHGRQAVFWLLAVVWSTEIGAYVAGRGLGGAKLAPTISPNKTWAGFFGGLAAAAAVAAIIGVATPGVASGRLALLSTLLALVVQSGDLVESAIKRLFGVKDSSSLIPGHGGLLDRVDGLMAGSLAVATFAWLTRGEL